MGATVGERLSRDTSNEVENEWLRGSTYFSGVPNGTHQTTERPLSFTIDLLVVAA